MVLYNICMPILVNPKNIAVTRECRYKVAFLKTSEEHLYDTIERLVDKEIKELGIVIKPMPSDY